MATKPSLACIRRSITDSWIWGLTDKQLRVWIYLISITRGTPKLYSRPNYGIRVEVGRGEAVVVLAEAGKACNCSRGVIRRVLLLLEDDGAIVTISRDTRFLLVRWCNYETYNFGTPVVGQTRDRPGTDPDPKSVQTRDRAKPKKGNGVTELTLYGKDRRGTDPDPKHEQGSEQIDPDNRSEKNPPTPRGSSKTYQAGFLRAWKAYPHYRKSPRSVKGGAYAVWKKRSLEPLTDRVLEWIASYAGSEDFLKDERKYVPGMQVWLGTGAKWNIDFTESPEQPGDWAGDLATDIPTKKIELYAHLLRTGQMKLEQLSDRAKPVVQAYIDATKPEDPCPKNLLN